MIEVCIHRKYCYSLFLMCEIVYRSVTVRSCNAGPTHRLEVAVGSMRNLDEEI